MKELNVVSSNVSLVFDGNKIQVSKPTENQDKILECENSIEIIKNNIEKNEKEIKENQKVMIKYGGSIISSSLGIPLVCFLSGILFKMATGLDVIPALSNIDIALFSTLVSLPISAYVTIMLKSLKKAYLKSNILLRNENSGYRKLLDLKESELEVLKTFDRDLSNKECRVSVIDTNRKYTIKQLRKIKEFYNTKTTSEFEFTGINLENDGVMMLKKVKK